MTRIDPESGRIFKTRGPLDPVRDSAVCVPRPELDELLRAAASPRVDAYLGILSSRQTGKTTMLYQLRARLRTRGYGIAMIDLAVLHDQAEAGLYQFVAAQMLSELEPVLGRLPGDRSPRALPSNALEFRRFLFDTARASRAARLVVLLDEVEAVPEKHADAFFGTVRNIFSSRRKEDEAAFGKYLFIFAGAKELHRLTGGSNSPLNIAERVYLEDFDLKGVRRLVSNLHRAGVPAPERAAEWVFEQTRGHPYLTQKLCSLVEQWHPNALTPELVKRASAQILKSDDHLEKMILQLDAEPRSRQLVEQVLRGQAVPFTRLNPAVARLELVGAIRDAGTCALRNPIYHSALHSHLHVGQAGPAARRHWLRSVVATITFLIFLINVPFLYNYTADILLATRSVNEQLTPAGLGSNLLIHYDRILQANSDDKTTITVDADSLPPGRSLVMTFQPDTNDIALEGTRQRRIDQPFHQERFTFSLNQSGLGVLHYNPFNPATDHRHITLVFESSARDAQPETYTADFMVDYVSAVGFSALVSLASLVTSLSVIFANVQRFRRLLGIVGRVDTQAT